MKNLHKLEMQRVKPTNEEDDDLLEGLDQLGNKEKEELEKKRANFTPRDVSKKDTPAREEKNEASGWASTAVIVTALAVAAAIFVVKKVSKS